MVIHTKYDELVSPLKLKPNPRNPNKHSTDQALRLSKLYEAHGVRHPIIVSRQSGYIVAGHGRHMAALMAEMKEFPVVYQDFQSESDEYAFMVSDNGIADWAELDYAKINEDLVALGPDFNIDDLGLEDFTLDVAEKESRNDLEPKPQGKRQAMCPQCQHIFDIVN